MPVITPSLPRPGENTVRILHEDAWLLLVEKPAGLLSVPGRLPQNRDSVALRVLFDTPGNAAPPCAAPWP